MIRLLKGAGRRMAGLASVLVFLLLGGGRRLFQVRAIMLPLPARWRWSWRPSGPGTPAMPRTR